MLRSVSILEKEVKELSREKSLTGLDKAAVRGISSTFLLWSLLVMSS